MNDHDLTQLDYRFSQAKIASLRSLSKRLGILVSLIGALVLIGWAFDLAVFKSAWPILAAMKPETGISFIVAGRSLCLLHNKPHQPIQRQIGQAMAWLVNAIGLLTLFDYGLRVNLDADQIFWRGTTVGDLAPDSMAVGTGLNFVLLGVALILLYQYRPKYLWVQALTCMAGLITFLAGLDYVYGHASNYTVDSLIPLPFHTAIGFLLLSLAILLADPERGAIAILVDDTAGGVLARRLLPAAILIPPLIGCLSLHIDRHSLHNSKLGLGFLTIANVIVFAGLVYWSAHFAAKIDRKRRRTEDELWQASLELDQRVQQRTRQLREINVQLHTEMLATQSAQRDRQQAEHNLRQSERSYQALIEQAPFGIMRFAPDGSLLEANPAWEKIWQTSRDGLVGYNILQEYRTQANGQLAEIEKAFAGETSVLTPIFYDPALSDRPGQPRWIEPFLYAVKDENGTVTEVVLLTSDITERKQAKEILEQRVLERTAKLTEANEQLEQELSARRVVEVALQQEAERQAAIIATQFEIATAGLDLNRVMHQVAEQSQQLTRASGAIVELSEGDELVYRAACGAMSGYVGTRLKIAASLSGHCFLSGKSFCCEDTESDPRVALELCRQVGIRSMLVVPLIYNRKTMGVLKVCSDQPQAFTGQDENTLQLLAGLLAAAIGYAAAFAAKQDLIAERTEMLAALQKSEEQYRSMVQDLRRSQEQLQLALEGTGDGVWDWNIQTNQVYFSPCWLSMLGYEADQLPNHITAWEKLVHPDDQLAVIEGLNAHFRDGTVPYRLDYRLLTKAGTWKWIANYGKVVIRDPQGVPLRMTGTHRDISDRKQAEEALFQEKELAQVTLQAIGDAVITTDACGLVQYLNPIAEALTGWSQAEAQGLPLSRVCHIVDEATRQPVTNPVEEALREGQILGLAQYTILIARDGREFAIDNSAAPIRNGEGEIMGAVMIFHDVSDTRRLTNQLSWQASHDPLTSLINRRELERQLEQAIAIAKSERKSHSLCYLDLDQFKIINDTCGHAAGDELLRQVTALFQQHIRKSDTLSRLGGDEFAVLLDQCPIQKAYQVAEAIREQLQAFRFNWQEQQFAIGVSIGLVAIDVQSENVSSVLNAADSACYVAKNRGRNRVHVYQADDLELARQQSQVQWVARLNQALEEDQFRLYYQPIVPTIANSPYGEHYEVLLRLHDQNGRIVAPMAFIPAAERYNLMHKIDRWVIRTLFASQGPHYREVWNQCLTEDSNCRSYLYAVNLSGASINDDQFIDFLHQQFALHQIPPQLICFEITETVAIANLAKAAQFIHDLRSLGCRFALDDFGSGMSSFAYLKNLPVDYLKIDGSFVKQIVDDPFDWAIVEAIKQISEVMGIQTIAEFVEDKAIFDRVRNLGVNYAQGYGIAKPSLLTSNPVEVRLTSSS